MGLRNRLRARWRDAKGDHLGAALDRQLDWMRRSVEAMERIDPDAAERCVRMVHARLHRGEPGRAMVEDVTRIVTDHLDMASQRAGRR